MRFGPSEAAAKTFLLAFGPAPPPPPLPPRPAPPPLYFIELVTRPTPFRLPPRRPRACCEDVSCESRARAPQAEWLAGWLVADWSGLLVCWLVVWLTILSPRAALRAATTTEADGNLLNQVALQLAPAHPPPSRYFIS